MPIPEADAESARYAVMIRRLPPMVMTGMSPTEYHKIGKTGECALKRRAVCFVAAVVLLSSSSFGKDEGDRAKLQSRLDHAGTILGEITSAPDKGVPQEILSRAKCVGVIPNLVKAGLGLGGEYGQGVVTCRTTKGWSAPAFYRLGGGSFGLQIGGAAVDVVMLFTNDRGVESLLTHKVKIGADATAAAGPVGRAAAADTDIALRSEILTYSRSRGAFVGISLKGSWFEQNAADTRTFYGRDVNFQNILNGSVRPPSGSEQFLAAVRKDFGEAKAAQRE